MKHIDYHGNIDMYMYIHVLCFCTYALHVIVGYKVLCKG